MNLTITAYWTRRIIKYGSILLVVFMILRSITGMLWNAYRAANPPPPPPPTVRFGQLPMINFPKNENNSNLSYKLETVSGTVPKLDTVGKVYFVPKSQGFLLSLERSKEVAKRMGFVGEPIEISSRLFQFQGKSSPPSILIIDIINGNFRISYDYRSDQSIFAEKKLPSDEQAVSEAKNFLQQAGLGAEDIKNGKAKISYLKLGASTLDTAVSLSEADFVKVDLYRADLDNLKILSSNPPNSLISFLISGNRSPEKRIVEVSYTYHPIELENSSTYPLKTSNAAWQELSSGKGYIANIGTNSDNQIVIRSVYLAYFESNETQNFLIPVFVFEGDKNFTAYVSAIENKWIAE